jgi:deoxyribonuclease V
MKQAITHPWALSETEAIALQRQLAQRVERSDRLNRIATVAGVDVAYDQHSNKLIAAVVVLNASTFEIVASATAVDEEQFPYIPGLFSFRELPSIAKALEKLDLTPDLIICDGQGIAHPRRFGLACHLGVLFDIPTIGCGKTLLLGTAEPAEKKRGVSVPLLDNDEVIGAALCTQDEIKPVYVSIGHRVSLETACAWVLKASTKYRLPETTRTSDHAVKLAMKALTGAV